MSIVYHSSAQRGQIWKSWLAEHAPDLPFYFWPETGDPQAVTYLVCWEIPENLRQQFPNLQVIFSVGAGADQFNYSLLPEGVTVVRMIEPGLKQDMVGYITFSVLALQRGMPRYLQQQQQQIWQKHPAPQAGDCRVGILGLGTLGQAAASQLLSLGFSCAGWSRTEKSVAGVRCWHGDDQLATFLSHTDILVCLLPLTDLTRGILCRSLFEQLPSGACLVHAGRGPQLNHNDLIQALDNGHLQHAIVDVTDPEPLPAGHPFWSHPGIWLTPHMASETRAESSVKVLLENIRRHQRGETMSGVIDATRGY